VSTIVFHEHGDERPNRYATFVPVWTVSQILDHGPHRYICGVPVRPSPASCRALLPDSRCGFTSLRLMGALSLTAAAVSGLELPAWPDRHWSFQPGRRHVSHVRYCPECLHERDRPGRRSWCTRKTRVREILPVCASLCARRRLVYDERPNRYAKFVPVWTVIQNVAYRLGRSAHGSFLEYQIEEELRACLILRSRWICIDFQCLSENSAKQMQTKVTQARKRKPRICDGSTTRCGYW